MVLSALGKPYHKGYHSPRWPLFYQVGLKVWGGYFIEKEGKKAKEL